MDGCMALLVHLKAEETGPFPHSAPHSNNDSWRVWICYVVWKRTDRLSCALLPCGLPSFIPPDADFEKITSVLLKSRTGEFDLESILFLKFRGLGKLNSLFPNDIEVFKKNACLFIIFEWVLCYRSTRLRMYWRMHTFGETGPLWE